MQKESLDLYLGQTGKANLHAESRIEKLGFGSQEGTSFKPYQFRPIATIGAVGSSQEMIYNLQRPSNMNKTVFCKEIGGFMAESLCICFQIFQNYPSSRADTPRCRYQQGRSYIVHFN